MRITRVPTALLLGAIVGLGFAPSSSACLCPETDGPPSRFRSMSRSIFLAQVLAAHGPYTIVGPGRLLTLGEKRRFTIRRIQSWEGEVGDTVIVETGSGLSSCAYDGFVVGGLYLVYASAGRDTVRTTRCTRTRPWTSAREDSVALRAPALDRSFGQPWSTFAPPLDCRIHGGVPVRRDRSIVVYGLSAENRGRFEGLVARKFPYSGVQLEPARADSARAEFSGAYVCESCRRIAHAWCTKQPHFMIALGPRAGGFHPSQVSR